uniref:Uncharacterized protein n=1 Tax=mine drainage metagenome TaxID=410659 RepID=E6QCB8_9ZZZZ
MGSSILSFMPLRSFIFISNIFVAVSWDRQRYVFCAS